MAPKDDMWVRRFVVSDPVKHKKGFTLYKVTSVVFPKKHPEAVTKIVVWKRYNDFKKLHKELKLKYQKLQLPDKFPPFVKAKFFKRFEDDVIEERRQASLVLLEFVAQHTALFTSDVFVKFFQCGYSVNSTTGTIEKIEPCLNGIVQPFPVDNSWSPTFKKREDIDSIPAISSEDDVTSFTTDTDSAISSPLPSSVDFIWPTFDADPSDREPGLRNRLMEDTAVEHDKESVYKTISSNTNDIPKSKNQDTSLRPGKISHNQHILKTKLKEIPLSVLWKPIDNLQYFKVLGVYAKAMLVIDTRDDSLHIVKALQKTPCPVFKKQSTIFPRQIPYMVGLHGIFETSTAIYLVIQNISSGKLWDYVTPYFPNSVSKLPSTDTSHLGYQSKDRLDNDCDDGKRRDCESSSESNCSISTNLTTTLHHSQSSLSSSDNENSYLELIRDYTSTGLIDVKHRSPRRCEINNSLSTENIPTNNISENNMNYSKSESALNVCDDDLVSKLTSDLTLFNLVAERLEDSKACSELVEKWRKLENLTDCNHLLSDATMKPSDTVINLSTISVADKTNKLATKVDSNNALNTDIPDVQIDSLVENARKLLQSVDETLMKSDCLVNKLDTCIKSDVIDNLIKSTDYLTSESDVLNTNILKTNIGSIKNSLLVKNNVLLKTENCDGNTSSPDSKVSRSPVHSMCQYDLSKLHPPPSCSRASSPVSSVSTDGEAQWWKQEIEGNGLKEETVKKWAAQLLIAINALHDAGIICRDLNPENILVLDGNIRLTYFCQFVGVEPPVDYKAVKKLYCAPEVSSIFPITESADWWSYGAILYELITGQSLISCHPGGFHCHTILYIPDNVSLEAQSLLKGLLQFNPSERLCSGIAGVDEIKCHPYFAGIDWRKALEDGLSVDNNS